MTDPRKGLPSASGFPRYALCPGSFLAEQSVDWKEDDDPDAVSGDRIHAALAGIPIAEPLTADESETADLCYHLARRVAEQVFGSCPDTGRWEERLWYPDPNTLEPLFSGQFDLLFRARRRVLVIDYKTGRNEVDAESSWQLRALAALVVENELVSEDERLFLAIVQPWVSPQVRVVEYNLADRHDALTESRRLARDVMRPGQPRVPSEAACRHCRAKAICPEARAVVAYAANLILPDGRQGEVLDAAAAAWLLDRCRLAERVIVGIRGRAKAILEENPNAIPGWHLKAGAVRQKIVDVRSLWERIAPLGVAVAQFTAACGMTKTDLRQLLRQARGLKGHALEETVAELLIGLVEEKQAAPQLQRVGETTTSGETT